jgi:hypothetical protein
MNVAQFQLNSPSQEDYIAQLLGRIRVCMRALKNQDHQDDAALLQDLIIRLRLWKKDVAIGTEPFRQYRLNNPDMDNLLGDQIGQIDSRVQKLNTIIGMGDYEPSSGPRYVFVYLS